MTTITFEEALEKNGSFCWKNVGVSMLPLIREGRDIICITKRPVERLRKYDVVLFKRPGVIGRGAYVLHRIIKVNPNGTYWIVGDNCISGETVDEENIIGVLSAVTRNGKVIYGNKLFRFFYLRFWCAPYPFRFFIIKSFRAIRLILAKVLHNV